MQQLIAAYRRAQSLTTLPLLVLPIIGYCILTTSAQDDLRPLQFVMVVFLLLSTSAKTSLAFALGISRSFAPVMFFLYQLAH